MWCPFVLPGNADPVSGNLPANTGSRLSFSGSALANFSAGIHYVAEWDWTWDSASNCYKGPGLNTCGAGQFRLQEFAVGLPAGSGGPGSVLTYTSPSCGPAGGSTSWGCGAWPATTAPTLGAAGTVTADPDTANRVLRVTQSGSFGEDAATAFKVFDGGWKQAWNANNTRFFVLPWSTGSVKAPAYWVGFDPAGMSLTGATGIVPSSLASFEWDQYDPDSMVGMVGGVAKTYNVATGAYTAVFDPSASGWGATPWLSAFGGNTVCIAEGPQDDGSHLVCFNRQASITEVINLQKQTINGSPFTVYFQGNPVTLPPTIGIHTITLAPDGVWLAIDTHGNSGCSTSKNGGTSTALFLNLQTNTGYEWNTSCGATHWAYGYDSVMMQSTSPRWSATGANGPCNSDSRGIARRNTDSTVDSSFAITQPCAFFEPSTYGVNVHLSWTNNANDANVNNYPVLLATTSDGLSDMFLWNDIAAMQTSSSPYQGTIWRFAQTWNDQTSKQCSFLDYSSAAISRDGRWALFPSNWAGQTGSNGVCKNGARTDLFLFELK